ncbi:MAG: co-chaperone GroES [Firmicutes bacterium]|nr:co-chaperone GroES [Bacillota bacterium]MBR4209310.1 co-chaperone GroES [Lachnospiraceae bacterium]
MTIKPLGDRVVIKMLEAEEKSKGGIFLPGQTKEEPQIAEVVAIGPGEVRDGALVPMQVKVGDKILFPKFMGVEVRVEGEDLIVIAEKDIFAILD